jgi:DNA-binding NtrC family response regulator
MTTEKRRILFVDDDPSLLAGLENVLRSDRRRWEMVFALGGEAALVELARGTFDVVVSDMRMPVVDGAQLLARVKADSPHTLRILLSGSDCESLLTEIHELVVKPCRAQTLRAVLERHLATTADSLSQV